MRQVFKALLVVFCFVFPGGMQPAIRYSDADPHVDSTAAAPHCGSDDDANLPLRRLVDLHQSEIWF